MNSAAAADVSLPDTDAWQRAKKVKAAWEGGEAPDIDAALRADPALEADEVVLLDLAYEEYRLRREGGEEVDPEAFCDRFPHLRSALRRMLGLDGMFSDRNGSMPSNIRQYLLNPVRWPEAGERVGDCTLVRELGRGAFARVFLAREASTGNRPVVVKLSLGGEREAQTLGRLAHPNIVPIWSCRRDEATALTIVCMPFLGGASLEDVLDRVHGDPAAPPRRAVELLQAARSRRRADDPPVPETAPEALLQGSYAAGVLLLGVRMAEALAFLHEQQVYHRDLKPSNVLLGPDGTPRLLDFNLAVEPDADKALLGGTLPYAAPEHIRAMLRAPDAPPPDARSDIFSLGVILYEMLTGRNPFGRLPRGFSSRELGEMLVQRQKAGCPAPQARGLHPAAARLVCRCLAFDPAERPTAGELATGLRDVLGPGRLRRWVSRHRRTLWALACLLPLVCGAGLAGSWGRRTEVRLPPQPGSEGRRTKKNAPPLPHEAGVEAYNKKDYPAAEEHFARALDADPNNVQVRLYHGFALLQASQEIAGNVDPERLGLAWSDFEEVHRRQPENGSARAGLAYCQAQKGHHDEVIALTEPDARTGAATTAVLNNLACAFLQRKSQLEAAEGALRAIAEPDRNLPAVRYNRAVLALKRRIARKDPVPQEALDDIRAVLGAYPAHWEPHRFAAQLCAYAAEDDRQRRAVLSGPFAAVSGDPTPLAGVLFALQPRWEEQVITHLRAARNLGMDRAFLEKDPLWRNLHDHPGFKALWSIQSPRVSPAPLALRLLNPAPPVLE